MKAKEIIELLIADSRLCECSGTFEYETDEDGNFNTHLITAMFGDFADILGLPTNGTTYIWQYSDTCQTTYGVIPNVIVILEDGRCVFLYAIE